MGWFSSGSPSPPLPPKPADPKPSSDGAYVAPNRTSRALCYEARDAFFECLDRHSILDPITDKSAADKACGKLDEEFEKNCAGSWVQYFKQRRVVEFKKEQTIKKIEAEGGEVYPPGRLPPR
ncbi:hypothetical protein K432DRAFT_356559 [Lepidopterella palustris CBS 459.81]|uniref:Cytochrome c oxidase assembly factor 6 n=1 Tax=Lepidopterella palustris CBS 459.81 TaxID=1314670 RepID=A0A8E2E789_9PEZI|nr:hypothetical protein K432DRAFT_356559 [Lepidopterella palustris CBS 459.81]